MTPLWSIGQNYNILLSPASWLSSPGVLGPQSAQQATSTGGSCQERRLPGGTLWCHLLPPRWPAEAGCACAPGSATHSWLLRVATFGISGGLGHEDVSCEQAGPPSAFLPAGRVPRWLWRLAVHAGCPPGDGILVGCRQRHQHLFSCGPLFAGECMSAGEWWRGLLFVGFFL